MKEFKAEILSNQKGQALMEMPLDVLTEYRKSEQVKVKATFDGFPIPWHFAKMGYSTHILIIRKDIHAQHSKRSHDFVHVKLERDIDERILVIPDDLE